MGRRGGLEGIAGHEPGREEKVLRRRWGAMTKKGKSRTRNARTNLLRCNVANARRRARKQAPYDRQEYDKPASEVS
ncbi:MAG: hypothetical protein FNP40_05845 [Dehalobacter sp. 4CP]|nr:hypothetical protein [Dehalobacter sp. 4CP]